MQPKYKKFLLIVILVVILLAPQIAFAEVEKFEEIYEVDSMPVNKDDIKALSDHFMIKEVSDLSVPKDSITSLDINDKGEILVCFTKKIVVFDQRFSPIRAYEVEWRKGNIPIAIWNEKSGNIVCIRSTGYEFNRGGMIVREYDTTQEEKYKKIKVKWDGKTYELQNRAGGFELSTKRNKTYSTLVMIDNTGKEKVLCDATEWQKKSQMIALLPIVFFALAISVVVIKGRKKARLRKLQYGGSRSSQTYKKVYVNARPRTVLKKK